MAAPPNPTGNDMRSLRPQHALATAPWTIAAVVRCW